MSPNQLFCGVPVVASLLNFLVSYFGAGFLTGSTGMHLTSAGLLVFVTLMSAGTVSAYVAYFDKRVSNVLAWTTIAATGAMGLATFAVLHAEAGVICAAPVCHGSLQATRHGQSIAVYHDLPTALYFSIVTFTTLGYGDLQPSTHMRPVAAVQALVGYVYLGLFVGSATHWGASR